MAVLAQNEQLRLTLAEGRESASLDNETEELSLSGCSSPA